MGKMSFLADKEICTGCMACVNGSPMNCIEMRPDEDRVAFPFVPDTSLCVLCGICEFICLIYKMIINRLETSSEELRIY